MFPFTQISNLYTYIFYEEVKCQNPSCNIKMNVGRNTIIKPTHCSVGCGYSDYEQHCQKLEEEKEKLKLKEIEEKEDIERKKREEIKKSICDEIYKEELEKMKEELKEEIRNGIRKKLELEKDKLRNEILNN